MENNKKDKFRRKRIRLENYDYSSDGAYFVTVCVIRKDISLWKNVAANCVRQNITHELSDIGKLVDNEIQKIETIYDSITVDKYCIMPDHIHMILFIDTKRRTQFAPTISRVIKQFKGAITKKLGFSIWQKSFNDEIIRNEKAYLEIWRYIDENPVKYLYEKH
ncbi:transposase [Ruminococcus sp.]|uniref:transposase n=1 Tax=Ruminococcus sp. TaxID=41978 RepID=UPI0026095ED0|nr:transposase [Ruminococcus sp.]MDD6989530.1 hypothetical protein [Ruminococcus sp.]MDY6202383.1 transposase [Ruminococcus sp.]